MIRIRRGGRLRRIVAAVLFAAAAARTGVADDVGAPLVISDFEDPAAGAEALYVGRGSTEFVELKAPDHGHALRWTLQPSGDKSSSYLDLHLPTPPDLGKRHVLQFRIRLDGERPGQLCARLENESGAWLGAHVLGVGAAWKTFSLDLDAMDRDGTFDPAKVDRVAFVVFGAKSGAYLLDDVELVASMPPPPAGAKKTHLVVADFEAPESMDFVDARHGAAERVAAGGKDKGFVLSWTPQNVGKTSFVEIEGAPRDVRDCRTLRFRVRADRPVTQKLCVRIESSVDDVLDMEVNAVDKQWKSVEMRLPEMDPMGDFDPRRVRDVSFIFFEAPDAVLQIDDVEMETAPGGWKLTEPEMLAHTFGEARAKKVAKIPTKHFEIYTDSAAAQGKFPKALETAYEFSKKTLGLPEMDEPLPCYIFQNSNLYFDFCVRCAHWTKEEAEKTAGHGSGRYFATYYQSPDAPVVVHELTHSIVHRAIGGQGGSWLQEGIAVYVEHLWQRQSAAESFAAGLRTGQFVHLPEFMKMPQLIDANDVKGGAKTADRLYLQAGAFYEFLVRGPRADVARGLIPILTRTPKEDAEQPAFVENLFGMSLEQIEKEWIAWGSEPPKPK
jgi:hypothetical protein